MSEPEIQVICNGEPRTLPGARTLAELLPALTNAERTVIGPWSSLSIWVAPITNSPPRRGTT